MNQEPEFRDGGSLNDRAVKMVKTVEYLQKVKMLKAGNKKIRFMEFIMDGVKIELPFNGEKVTQGYLKKETEGVNFLLSRTFQNKFCVLDLTKFCFKYSKDPKEKFKTILLKDVIDVVLETDPQRVRMNS